MIQNTQREIVRKLDRCDLEVLKTPKQMSIYFSFKNGKPFKDFQQLRVINKVVFLEYYSICKTGEGREWRKRHHLKRHVLWEQ